MIIDDKFVFENGIDLSVAEVVLRKKYGFQNLVLLRETDSKLSVFLRVTELNVTKYLAFLGENDLAKYSLLVEMEANS